MGKKTTVINQTGQDIQIREFRNKSVNYFDVIELGANKIEEVDGRKYRDRAKSTKQISLLKIWGKRSERLAKMPVPLVAQDFIDSKTITITGEGLLDDRDYRFVVTKESHGGEKISQKEDPIEEGGSDKKKDPNEEGGSDKKKDRGSDKKKDPDEEGGSDKKKDPVEEGGSDKEEEGESDKKKDRGSDKNKDHVEKGGSDYKKDPTEEGGSDKKKDQGSDKKKDPVEEGRSDKKKDPGEEGGSDKKKGGHEQNQKKKSPVENGGGEQKMTKN